MRKNQSTVFVCITVHNRIEFTLKCIQSLQRQEYQNVVLVICDDGSNDGTAEVLGAMDSVILVAGSGNLWWAGGTNAAVKKAIELSKEGDFIYTLNNDTEVLYDTLNEAVKVSIDHSRCIVGSLNLFFDDINRIENSAFKWTRKWGLRMLYPVHGFGEQVVRNEGLMKVDSLSGKGVLIPIEVFRTIGLYDQENLPQYHADTVFIHRAKSNGFEVLLSFSSRLKSHVHATSSNTFKTQESFIGLFKSYGQKSSPHYWRAIIARNKAVYSNYRFSFHFTVLNFIFIFLGFVKRRIND